MKVLVLHSELGVLWGGGETFTTSLFKAFARRGHEVSAAFVADRQSRYPRTLPDEFQLIPVPGWWSRKPGQTLLSVMGSRLPDRLRPRWTRLQEALSWRTIHWHNHRFQRRIEADFAETWAQFDAVYVNGNVGLAHAAASRRPTLLMLPGPVSSDEAWMLPGIQAVCAHDDGLTVIREILGERALELPLGLDTSVFHPAPSPVRADLGWSDGELVFGFVGRLDLIKGIDLLGEAFAAVSQSVPEARLMIVGSGEEEQRVRTVLANQIGEGKVHVQPRMSQERLPDWYRAMDILLMPSRYETMSNAVLEGMACGVPFIASAVGGSRNLADLGAGWLHEPESVSSLRDAMLVAARRRSELKCFGARGSRHVLERYSWTGSAERLEHILRTRLEVSA
jgi:glycosyltransferase involved in cell wall biosynthesis